MLSSELYNYFKESSSVSTDTRLINKGSIFFALKGENFDGNKFAEEAIKSGASYAVIDDQSLNNPKFIKVKNVLKSLQDLSKFHRSKLLKTKIIALTGSNGKTTTKELISEVLKKKYKNIILFMGSSGRKILNDTLKEWDLLYEEKKSLTNDESFILNIKKIEKKVS